MIQSSPSQPMFVDLVQDSDGIVADSAVIVGPLWASSSAQIIAIATQHHFSIDAYESSVGATIKGRLTFTNLQQVQSWILTTSQYAGAVSPAPSVNPPASSSAAAAIVGVLALGGLALLAFWPSSEHRA